MTRVRRMGTVHLLLGSSMIRYSVRGQGGHGPYSRAIPTQSVPYSPTLAPPGGVLWGFRLIQPASPSAGASSSGYSPQKMGGQVKKVSCWCNSAGWAHRWGKDGPWATAAQPSAHLSPDKSFPGRHSLKFPDLSSTPIPLWDWAQQRGAQKDRSTFSHWGDWIQWLSVKKENSQCLLIT